MLHLFSDYLTTILFRKCEVADPSKREIYEYGFKLLISTVFSMLAILLVSAVLNKFSIGLTFLAVYIPCRMVSGGYHAKTYSKCFWISMVTYLCVVFVSQLPHSKWSLLLLIAFYSSFVFLWAPVVNPKHPLSDGAILRNKWLARLIVIVLDVLAVYKIHTHDISESICVVVTSLAAVAVMMIILKLQERRGKYESMGCNRNFS